MYYQYAPHMHNKCTISMYDMVRLTSKHSHGGNPSRLNAHYPLYDIVYLADAHTQDDNRLLLYAQYTHTESTLNKYTIPIKHFGYII